MYFLNTSIRVLLIIKAENIVTTTGASAHKTCFVNQVTNQNNTSPDLSHNKAKNSAFHADGELPNHIEINNKAVLTRGEQLIPCINPFHGNANEEHDITLKFLV